MEILIAEDDEQIANSLKKNLAEEGHHIMVVHDGQKALRSTDSILFDVIILDWRMPKVTGVEVCKHLRNSGNKVPVILLTALSQVANKVEALQLGADDYITKPFSFDELKARIEAVVRRYQTNEKELIVANLKLDLLSRKVSTPFGEISLTGKEYDLLKYFILHKGSIIGKEELTKSVWELNYSSGTNVIEVTIKNLREKLEEKLGKKLIKSVYGEGYIFIPE